MPARRLLGGAALFSCAALVLAQPATPAFAPSNLTPDGVRDLAASCAPCHGPDGRAVAGSPVPALAGGHDIAARLRALRETRTGTSVMPQIARGLTDAEIDALAAWFAAREVVK